MPPDVHHVECGMFVVAGGVEQTIGDRHRRGNADEAEQPGPVRMASAELESDERAHAVPHDGGARHLRRVEGAGAPVRHRRDARKRIAAGAPVSRQIERQHVVPVVGEVAALEDPDAVVQAASVDEDDAPLCGHERAATRVGEGAVSVDVQFHSEPFLLSVLFPLPVPPARVIRRRTSPPAARRGWRASSRR